MNLIGNIYKGCLEIKALVLKAFDTLFNNRDYVAAERYWSPHYIQLSAHIAAGREGRHEASALDNSKGRDNPLRETNGEHDLGPTCTWRRSSAWK